MSYNQEFISYDKNDDQFYVWMATFGTWDHEILSRARTLLELQLEYPFALIGDKAQRVWDHKQQLQKVSS